MSNGVSRVIYDATAKLLTGADLCRRNGLSVPAQALGYMAVDTLAGLGMPEGQDDVNRAAFMQWVKKYLIPFGLENCDPIDIYASRCGVVHGFTSEARLVREQKATRIFFVWGAAIVETLQNAIDLRPRLPAIALHVDTFLSAVTEGRSAFLAHLESDDAMRDLANARAAQLFSELPHDPTKWEPGES